METSKSKPPERAQEQARTVEFFQRFLRLRLGLEAAVARLMLDEPQDVLDDDDLAAIEESEQQIRRGEVLDFRDLAAELRAKYPR